MTEHQIDKLKMLLDASNALDNSPELDQRILRAAGQNINNVKKINNEEIAQSTETHNENTPSSYNDESSLYWALSGLKSSVFQAAALSVVITVSLLLVISQVVMVEPEPIASDSSKPQPSIYFEPSGRLDEPINNDSINLVDRRLTEPQITQPESIDARNQVLAQMNLPSVETVLNDMPFTQPDHRLSAQKVVRIAMADIRLMLDSGKLSRARLRYAQLKDSCLECTLPETLDDFASNYRHTIKRS